MSAVTLDPQQEQQAQALAARIRVAVDADVLELARLLVSKPEAESFGQTEFEIRAIVHHVGAKALQTHRAGKKPATGAPVSSARTAARPRSSKTTDRASR